MTSAEFIEFLTSQEIQSELAALYFSQQDRVSERAIQTVNNIVNCLLYSASAPAGYGAEAVSATVYIKNTLPTEKVGGTLWVSFHGEKPDLSHLCVWGCLAYGKILLVEGKFSPRMQKEAFIGYCLKMKNYKINVPDQYRLVVFHDVAFYDTRIFLQNDEYPLLPLQRSIQLEDVTHIFLQNDEYPLLPPQRSIQLEELLDNKICVGLSNWILGILGHFTVVEVM